MVFDNIYPEPFFRAEAWEFALTRLEACPRETIESILVCSVWESAMLSSQAWPLDISKALFEVSFLDSGFGKR